MDARKLGTKQILSKNLARKPTRLVSDTIIFLHNLRSLHNIGSAFRSADAFGARMVILSGYSPVPPRPEISKTALGADESVAWKYSNEPLDSIRNLKEQGYLIIGIEHTNQSIPLNEFSPSAVNDKLCFLFGNEVTGIDNKLLEECDLFIEIPQYGQKHSLNVSVCIGVVLYSMVEKTSS